MARLSPEEKLRRKRLRERVTRRRRFMKEEKKVSDLIKNRRNINLEHNRAMGRKGNKKPGQVGWYGVYKGRYRQSPTFPDPRGRRPTYQPVFRGKRNPRARVIPKGSEKRNGHGAKTKHNRYLKPEQWNRYGIVNPKLPSRYEKKLFKRQDRQRANYVLRLFERNEIARRQGK